MAAPAMDKISKMGRHSSGPLFSFALGVLVTVLLVSVRDRGGSGRAEVERGPRGRGARPPPPAAPRPPPQPPPAAPQLPPLPADYARARVLPGPSNLFFAELSCAFKASKKVKGGESGGVALDPTEACSVYSAALWHPGRKVYLFHTCPLHFDYYSKSSEEVRRLLELPNVEVVPLEGETTSWFLKTPLQKVAEKMVDSDKRTTHLALIFRHYLLWKYGGTYLDLDIFVLRNLFDHGEDWVAYGRGKSISDSILSLRREGVGHEVASAALDKFIQTYGPKSWSLSGSEFLTQVVKGVCQLSDNDLSKKEGRSECGLRLSGRILSVSEVFWKDMLKAGKWAGQEKLVTRASAVQLPRTGWLTAEPGSALTRVVDLACPIVYKTAKSKGTT